MTRLRFALALALLIGTQLFAGATTAPRQQPLSRSHDQLAVDRVLVRKPAPKQRTLRFTARTRFFVGGVEVSEAEFVRTAGVITVLDVADDGVSVNRVEAEGKKTKPARSKP